MISSISPSLWFSFFSGAHWCHSWFSFFNECYHHIPRHSGLKSQSYSFLPQTILNVSFLGIEILFCYLCAYPTQHLAWNKSSRSNGRMCLSSWPHPLEVKLNCSMQQSSSVRAKLCELQCFYTGESMDMSVNPLKILWDVFASGYRWLCL